MLTWRTFCFDAFALILFLNLSTFLTVPLIIVNSACIVLLLLFGWHRVQSNDQRCRDPRRTVVVATGRQEESLSSFFRNSRSVYSFYIMLYVLPNRDSFKLIKMVNITLRTEIYWKPQTTRGKMWILCFVYILFPETGKYRLFQLEINYSSCDAFFTDFRSLGMKINLYQ